MVGCLNPSVSQIHQKKRDEQAKQDAMFSILKSVAFLVLLISPPSALALTTSPSSSSSRKPSFVSSKAGPSTTGRLGTDRGSSTPSYSSVSSSPETTTGRDLPSWKNLPSKPDFDNMDASLTTEIWVGRLAMVGAAGLIAKEIGTGESFADQVMVLLSSLQQ